MKWEKLGLIWAPSGEPAWAQTHATLPVVNAVSPDCWWVYLSVRDENAKSRIGRLELDVRGLPYQAPLVRAFDTVPALSLGAPGTFDDSGVMPSWLVQNGDELRCYYIGWNVIGTVPYRLSVGLALSDDGGATFRRYSPGPIIDRSAVEPFFATAPCVLRENDVWRLWYVSCTGWKNIEGRWEPAYHVKYGESHDGITWRLTGVSCIEAGDDYAVARPCVFRQHERYVMIYAYRLLAGYRTDRNSGYRLGYAESADGISWERMDDHVGIERAEDGWDSEMMEYGWIQQHAGETYLLYNGNGFGRSGFGMARLMAWD